jgi:hypothetical protein
MRPTKVGARTVHNLRSKSQEHAGLGREQSLVVMVLTESDTGESGPASSR